MDINIAELKQKFDNEEELILIDVREDYEHEHFNLGGHLIPLSHIFETAEEFIDKKDDEIIVYCRSGVRSASAQYVLQSLGFTNVRNLIGGVVAWQGAYGFD